MGRKVLVLTGSPRRNGNSFALADAFIRGAEAAGHEVMRFDAASASIQGCHACNQCYRQGQACVFHDDFNRLAPMLEEALMLPKYPVELKVGSVNMMSVTVPVFDFGDSARTAGDNYAYGLVSTCAELDDSVAALSGVLPMLLRLAQMEKAAQLLAGEIEKTRRRVNALEYVQIPSYEETIRYITMKLDENERSNLARLMKVKDMMLEDAHHYKSRRQANPE